MLVEIRSKETRVIALPATKYVLYADRLYYRFTPILKGEKLEYGIEVLSFDETPDGVFSMSNINWLSDSNLKIMELGDKYCKEISEDEFNSTLQALLLKHI